MARPVETLSTPPDDSSGPGPRDARTGRPLPPRTPYEQAVVDILKEVLGCTDVAVNDPLLALGDLAEVPRVIAQVRRTMGLDIPVADYVESQTVGGLAAAVAARSLVTRRASRPPALVRRADDARPVLSFDQQRLWLENQLLPGSIYNVHGRRRILGALDVAVLEASIRAIITRHETLRTRFPTSDTTPVQVVDEPEGIGNLRIEDLRASGDDAERAGQVLLDRELTEPFDLETGGLIRCLLIRLGESEHLLGVTMHHIVSDAWSIGLFVRELIALYQAGGDPGSAGLAPLDVQYRDYAVWQRDWLTGAALEFRLSHWRDHLRGAPRALALPTVQRRTSALRAEAGQVWAELTADETRALHMLCREHGVTSFMVLYAVFATVLARWSGQRDVVVGVPVAGRNSSSTDRLIGFFVNLLPLRVDLSDNPAFDILLERVRGIAVSGYACAEAPMDEVVRDLNVVRDPRRTPLFEVVLNVVASPEAEEVSALAVEPMDTPSLFSRYDLTLTAQESRGVLRFKLDFPADRCDAAAGHELMRQLRTLLRAAIDDPRTRLLDASVGEPEAVPATASAAPPEPHRSVGRHAGEPGLVAVVDGSGPRTYAWMSAAADRVAAELARRGIGGTEPVSVVRRPTAAFVAVLAGAAQAGLTCTVIETGDPASTEPLGISTVLDPGPIGEPAAGAVDLSVVLPPRTDRLPAPAGPRSGGEGEPGARPLGWGRDDRVVVLTARPGHLMAAMRSAFDAGAALVIPDRAFGTDVAALAEWLRDNGVTVAYASGPILRALSALAPLPQLPALRCVVIDNTGDLLPHDLEAVREMAPGCRCVSVYRMAADGRPLAVYDAPADVDHRDAPLRVPLGIPLADVPVELRRESGRRAAIGEVAAIWCGQERTGDCGRRWPDGTLEYVAESAAAAIADPVQTVAALRDVPGVRDAVVLRHADADGGTCLVGYVAGPEPECGPTAVHGHVKARLPEYLVPHQVFVLDTLPRTPWGEYDLRALPRPVGDDDPYAYAAPRTPVERQLTAIIESLLGIERVGVYDSFFELGGFSMLATQLITRVRDTFGVQLAVRDVFESPTVDELGRLVVKAQAEQIDLDDLEALLREVEQA